MDGSFDKANVRNEQRISPILAFQITFNLYLIINSKVQEWDSRWEDGFFPEPDFSHLLGNASCNQREISQKEREMRASVPPEIRAKEKEMSKRATKKNRDESPEDRNLTQA